MKKFIVSQNFEIIWGVADDAVIQRNGNSIIAVGYPVYEDDYEDKSQIKEDVAEIGLKKHLIELGAYDSEEHANTVMIFLVRWLKGLDGADSVFIMPEYNEHITCIGNQLMYCKEDLIEELGGTDE